MEQIERAFGLLALGRDGLLIDGVQLNEAGIEFAAQQLAAAGEQSQL